VGKKDSFFSLCCYPLPSHVVTPRRHPPWATGPLPPAVGARHRWRRGLPARRRWGARRRGRGLLAPPEISSPAPRPAPARLDLTCSRRAAVEANLACSRGAAVARPAPCPPILLSVDLRRRICCCPPAQIGSPPPCLLVGQSHAQPPWLRPKLRGPAQSPRRSARALYPASPTARRQPRLPADPARRPAPNLHGRKVARPPARSGEPTSALLGEDAPSLEEPRRLRRCLLSVEESEYRTSSLTTLGFFFFSIHMTCGTWMS
jgi:hypothetical protein